MPLLGGSALFVRDLCWLDDNTMVLIRSTGKQVLKLTVNTQTHSCTFEKVDYGFYAERVSCSPDGKEFYVTDWSNGYIRVYDRNGLATVIWDPVGLESKPYSVALNSKLVAVGDENGNLFIYDRQRNYLKKVIINQNRFYIYATYLTLEGIFWYVTGQGSKRFVIHDLNDHSTITITGPGDGEWFSDPTDVCTVGDYVLITDKKKHTVSVYTLKGKFVHHLLFKGNNIQYPIRIDFASGKLILAVLVEGGDFNKIRLFSLGPC